MTRKTTWTPRRLLRGEEGTVTVFGLYLVASTIAVGGIALDVANAYRVRTELQVAGDAAAHAALVTREFHTAAEAVDKALAVAHGTLPTEIHGDTLRAGDIYFGTWDTEARAFSFDSSSKTAVLVDTGRLTERGNSVATYLLSFFGEHSWNVRRSSVFITYKPTCLREGFVGDDVVDVQSGNTYWAGFCIHSNERVSLNSGNVFQDGAIVSMPDMTNVDIPSSGMESNSGLSAALRDGSYPLHIINRIEEVISGVQDPTSDYFRDWVDGTALVETVAPSMTLEAEDFTPGRINVMTCGDGSKKAQIHQAALLSEVVIVTNCELKFGSDVALENSTIVNTNTSADSFNSASGVRLGMNDNCAEGGGAQLVTLGGINFPSSLQMYGGQMLAVGDISFTANANGIQGASIVSGGRVEGTTNSNMAFCNGAGMEDNFEAWYFKLAL